MPDETRKLRERLAEGQKVLAHAVFNANASGTDECIMSVGDLAELNVTLRLAERALSSPVGRAPEEGERFMDQIDADTAALAFIDSVRQGRAPRATNVEVMDFAGTDGRVTVVWDCNEPLACAVVVRDSSNFSWLLRAFSAWRRPSPRATPAVPEGERLHRAVDAFLNRLREWAGTTQNSDGYMAIEVADIREGLRAALTTPTGTAAAEIRATDAYYHRDSERLSISLTTGATLTVPVKLVQGLADAKPHEVFAVQIIGDGVGLSWPHLDVDLNVEGLLRGSFGNRKWMSEVHVAPATGTAEPRAEWLRKMAAKEDEAGSISVGGLVSDVGFPVRSTDAADVLIRTEPCKGCGKTAEVWTDSKRCLHCGKVEAEPRAVEGEGLRSALWWALEQLREVAGTDEQGTPVHSCDFRTRPDKGACTFHERFWEAMELAGRAEWLAAPRPESEPVEEGICGLCGKPLPPGEEMFRYHGYSGPCPESEPDTKGVGG